MKSKYRIVAIFDDQPSYWTGNSFQWEESKAKLFRYRESARKCFVRLIDVNPAIMLQEVHDNHS